MFIVIEIRNSGIKLCHRPTDIDVKQLLLSKPKVSVLYEIVLSSDIGYTDIDIKRLLLSFCKRLKSWLCFKSLMRSLNVNVEELNVFGGVL